METGYKAVEGCQFRGWKTLKTGGRSWEKCKPRAGLERHAELCGPVFAQQFRLGHDGKRGLLLLVRGVAMCAENAFHNRPHAGADAFLYGPIYRDVLAY